MKPIQEEIDYEMGFVNLTNKEGLNLKINKEKMVTSPP